MIYRCGPKQILADWSSAMADKKAFMPCPHPLHATFPAPLPPGQPAVPYWAYIQTEKEFEFTGFKTKNPTARLRYGCGIFVCPVIPPDGNHRALSSEFLPPPGCPDPVPAPGLLRRCLPLVRSYHRGTWPGRRYHKSGWSCNCQGSGVWKNILSNGKEIRYPTHGVFTSHAWGILRWIYCKVSSEKPPCPNGQNFLCGFDRLDKMLLSGSEVIISGR